MPTEADCTQRRLDILKAAKKQADEGAHYLWATSGLRPAARTPGAYADVVLDKGQPDKSTFCAAKSKDGATDYVCAGRCFHGGLAKQSPAAKLVQNPATDQALQQFIGKYQGSPNAQYNWNFDLTPRLVLGDRIMDYSTNTDITNKVVWGEGCDDTMHFDCGGFVRWIVRQVCKVSIEGIAAAGKNAHGQTLGTLLDEGDPMLPGDILVYKGHIGLAIAAHGEVYSKVTSYALAQAECATLGVTYGTVHKQHNVRCIRLTDSALFGGS